MKRLLICLPVYLFLLSANPLPVTKVPNQLSNASSSLFLPEHLLFRAHYKFQRAAFFNAGMVDEGFR
jgi:hypothetical protein